MINNYTGLNVPAPNYCSSHLINCEYATEHGYCTCSACKKTFINHYKLYSPGFSLDDNETTNSDWVKVSDKLPAINQTVLIKLSKNSRWKYKSYVDAVIYEGNHNWHLLNGCGGYDECEITEWRNFPDL